jgi:hypothetical protein
MREGISIAVASAFFILVAYLVFSGSVILSDFWTGLAVGLTLIALGVLYWGFKPQINRSFMEKRKFQNVETEIAPSMEMERQKRELLPASADIIKLNVDDSLLDMIYEKAHSEAIGKYHDAQLSGFVIQAFPFIEVGSRVTVYLYFFSKWADKTCHFAYSDTFPQVKHMPPDNRPKFDIDREIFTTLPWKKSPQWMQFLRRCYARIGPFAPADMTYYHLSAYPKTNREIFWKLSFSDAFSGEEHMFEWNGQGLDENNVKQLD